MTDVRKNSDGQLPPPLPSQMPPPLPAFRRVAPPAKKERQYSRTRLVIVSLAAVVLLAALYLVKANLEENAGVKERTQEESQGKDGGDEKKGTYTAISKDFNFVIEFNNTGNVAQELISIYRKHDNSLYQRLVCEVNIPALSGTSRSYTTGYMKNASCVDLDCGDIIVADLNFDGLEDFGIKQDCSNSGCSHAIFIQSKEGGFYKDEELTHMLYNFPSEFDQHLKKMTIYGISGCCETTVTTVTYDNGRWKKSYIVKDSSGKVIYEEGSKDVENVNRESEYIRLPQGFECLNDGEDWIVGNHQLFRKDEVEFIGYSLSRYKGAEILDSQVISHNLSSINEETISNIVDDLIQDYIIDFDSEDIRSLEDSLRDVYEIPEDNIEQWLMSKLSQENLTKHYEHLMYLSGLHERNLFPLKVTGKPISLLFGFRKENMTLIVWETHNTKEATYIWRMGEQATGGLLDFISDKENLVKNLRQGNKRSYRSANKTNSDFKVIEHDYNLPQNGFEKWRSAVEEYINGH